MDLSPIPAPPPVTGRCCLATGQCEVTTQTACTALAGVYGGDGTPCGTCQPAPCPANCDGSTTSPKLNVLDFSCFLNKYAAGDTYADCDHNGDINVLDFACFINRYAEGCP